MFDNEDTVDFCFCFFSFIRLDDFVKDGIPRGLAAASLELVVDLMDRFLVIMENLFSSLLTTTDLGCGCIEWTDKSSAVKNEPLLPKSTSSTHCLRIPSFDSNPMANNSSFNCSRDEDQCGTTVSLLLFMGGMLCALLGLYERVVRATL